MSLLEKLPKIVEQGRKTAEQILESLEGRQKISLQTRELVLPSKDRVVANIFQSQVDDRKIFNRLIYGDNLLAIAALLAGDEFNDSLRGKLDLIYIDPPFDSKADYRTKIKLPNVSLEQKPTVIEQYAYGDTWSNGTASYLQMIVPRLILMRELLKDTGAIYVHLDWHVGHYVKIVMDEIFGKDCFENEIIWQKCNSKNFTQYGYSNIHDSIYFYVKSVRGYFEPDYIPLNEEYVQKSYRNVDGDGRRYRILPLHAPGVSKGDTGEEWRGMLPPAGNHWRYIRSTLDDMWLKELIVISSNGVPGYKKYLDDSDGIRPGTIWTDIKQLPPSEKTDYATQKPEQLIERLIQASCPKDGIVADFFAGSGTTASVAERLGRKWIATDLGKPSCMVIRKRLIDMDANPFLYQAIGDYQVETVRSTLGKKFTMGELAKIVIELYGALPLPQDNNPNKDRGYIGKTLVICDSPNKITGLPTLKKAQALRDMLMGGWDKVVVLGWNFASDIGYSVAQLGDIRLEVLVIPPDLMDRLRKKGSFEKLKDNIRFSSLQYLTVKKPKITKGIQDTIEIELENYVLLSPEAINLDEANRTALHKIMNSDPLSLIEYWAIDVNYDGEIFRSLWQDYRGNTDKVKDDLHVVRRSLIKADPVSGIRRISVRAVDVFGFESEVQFEV
jgi:adenine-specific DNA-methyltransferase